MTIKTDIRISFTKFLGLVFALNFCEAIYANANVKKPKRHGNTRPGRYGSLQRISHKCIRTHFTSFALTILALSILDTNFSQLSKA